MTQTMIHQWNVQPTSRAALNKLNLSGERQQQESTYFSLLCGLGTQGLTDGEAASLLGWPRSTVSARRNGVMKHLQKEVGHVIVQTGERRKNPGNKSQTAIVWRYRFIN